MNREITIRNYADTKTTVSIPDFEKVVCIFCEVISGDETLNVLYENGDSIDFDSSEDRIMDYRDDHFIIYLRGHKEGDFVEGHKDLIDAFSKRETSYDEVKGEEE